MATTLQDSLRTLIAKGKTQQALDALADNLKGTDEGDTITLLQSRWNRNKNANNMGVLSGGEYQMENNRINYALLSVIGELDDSTGKEAVIEKVQQVIIHIGDIIAGDKVMGNKKVSNTSNINSGNTTNTNSGNTNSGNTNSGNTNSGNTNTNSGNTTTNTNSGNTTNTTIGATSAADKDPSVQKKKTILFIAANPRDKAQLTSDRESQCIKNAITSGTLRDVCQLEINFASNVNDLLRLLKKFRPSIVHLSMHGSQNKGMLFEDAAGGVDYVSADTLASFFELINLREKTVECVIFSACNSDVHAEMVRPYVDCTIGMQGAIPDEAAIEYTDGFYTSLLEGDDYEMAHRTARIFLKRYASKVTVEGDISIADMPKLFMPHPNT